MMDHDAPGAGTDDDEVIIAAVIGRSRLTLVLVSVSERQAHMKPVEICLLSQPG
jgi:hypothetical protein